MSAYREFTGKSVEEALKNARDAFGAGLDDLDFEILTPGSRGVLGMGAEPARIVAAPRSELGGAAPKREAAASQPLPPPPPREDRGGYGDRDRGPRRDFGDRPGGGYRDDRAGGGFRDDRGRREGGYRSDRGPRPDDRGPREYSDRPPSGERPPSVERPPSGDRPPSGERPAAASAEPGGAPAAGRSTFRPAPAGGQRQGGGYGGGSADRDRGPRRDYGDRPPRPDDRGPRQGGGPGGPRTGGGPRPEGQGAQRQGGGRPPSRDAQSAGRSDLTASEVAEVNALRGSLAAERADLEAAEASPEALKAGQEILEELMKHLGFVVRVEVDTGETSRLNVVGDGEEKEALGALIGRKGERLSALQHLVNLMLSRKMNTWTRVLVDVEDYRGRRERQLRDLATRAAERVAETGKMLQLEPMPALERRWIHIALRDNPNVGTQSIGEEPNRRVVVVPRQA